MDWKEFTLIYLFGIVTGIFLFGFVYALYCIDEIIIKMTGERDENKNNKTSRKGLR